MLKESILKYQPINVQEENDKKLMLEYINTFDDVLTRKNEMCHFTASAWVVNKEKTKVLMIYHNIYKSWAWTGGHADGDENLAKVALKEVEEETGLKNLKLKNNDIFSLEILNVNGHYKKNKYVSAHVHLNITYLIEALEEEALILNEEETSGVKWIDINKVVDTSNEDQMKVVYQKLINKM